MIRYYCDSCDEYSDINKCAGCGSERLTANSRIYWCDNCNVPLYEEVCPECGSTGRYIATDIRPVFPEERLLVEILREKPFEWADCSVWKGAGSRYIVNGELVNFSVGKLKYLDTDKIRDEYLKLCGQVDYSVFDEYTDRFIKCNKYRYDYICQEAMDYINHMCSGKSITDMFISFSGGKDSTVTADLVKKALGNSGILHIFGDTTLEFPQTVEYVNRYRKSNPGTLMVSSRNKEKDFMELCETIGPPSRVMRWCCTVFKTGAIQRKITALFKNKSHIITFYGIRRSESASRSKYDRNQTAQR